MRYTCSWDIQMRILQLGHCNRSLTHAACQQHIDVSWNALPSRLFLTLMKACGEKVCWHSNEEWVTTILCYPETKCQCNCSIFIFFYITKGQSGLKILLAVEPLPLQSLLFVCMGMQGLRGLNFSRTAKNFNSSSPFSPLTSSLSHTG